MHQTSLERTQLGRTGLQITRVGFGAWAIGGGGWEFGWGPQDDEDSITAIRHALDLGVNWIDTAAAYGFGRSEQVVGRALQGLPPHRRPYVFTKASLVEGPGRSERWSGLLTGAMTRERIAGLPEDDWRKHDPDYTEPRLSDHLRLVERIRAVAGRHGTSAGAVAVAWTLSNPAVDGAIVGFRRPGQVDGVIGAASLQLTDDDLATIEASA
jgi:aryl-alcohol dehydrogenase-like predicted oxidoreductase